MAISSSLRSIWRSDVAAFFPLFEFEDVGHELLGDGGRALAFSLHVLEGRREPMPMGSNAPWR